MAGLLGVVTGAWLLGRREKINHKHDFMKEQLKDFYSPMLSIWEETLARGHFRRDTSQAMESHWQDMVRIAMSCDPARRDEILKEERPTQHKLIEYQNKEFREHILPAYQRMLDVFRANMWLAEPETRTHYEALVRYLALWDCWLSAAMAPEAVQKMGDNSGEVLDSFYKHIREKHDEIRGKLSRGEA
jgi:hypothetical protein